ncbi:MAG TPA: His-Xaa-Ser system radical SAM maturase HxsB [Elusimicrobiota bacterium]|jgi:His-Xaa-Ser system radical SAM maturase HxsB|nr:His-Xaa-Ser system radical SAM maturase HxsB [Elusimicrobiota bacterium]
MAKSAPAEDSGRLTRYADAGSVSLADNLVSAAAYRKVGERYLVTNDIGHFAQLEPADFKAYLSGSLQKGGELWKELQGKGFVRDHLDFDGLAEEYRNKNNFLFTAAPLHIIVTTLRCNYRCLYCHSSVVGLDQVDKDMTLETAKKTVDFIFQSPAPTLILEFQGGEPLLNWPVIKFITRYARLKNQAAKRNLFVTMVSNFSLLDEEKYAFLVDEKIGICTSLDGPADLHDKNRLFLGGSGHAETARWLKRFQEQAKGVDGKKHFNPGALLTTTRYTFGRSKDIVDEYVGLGLPGIFLRQLSPIGFAKRSWGKIGYTSQEFLAFYRETLDYILEINRRGTPFFERAALTALTKILRRRDPGYVDLRSPSGAALGVMAYDYNGDVYTGDEARMLAQEGDRFFRVGHVAKNAYNDALDNPVTKAAAMATLLENQPLCSQCAYRPYCGLDSVYNRAAQSSLWGHMPTNERCKLYMGLFDIVFEKLQNPRDREVFESWTREQ